MASPTRSPAHFLMLDARAYGDRLLPAQQGAVVTFYLARTGKPVTLRQVSRMCGISRSQSQRLMNDLEVVWPTLARRSVRRDDGRGSCSEWYFEE